VVERVALWKRAEWGHHYQTRTNRSAFIIYLPRHDISYVEIHTLPRNGTNKIYITTRWPVLGIYIYPLVFLLCLICIILDGAELFGGRAFLDIPFLLCALGFYFLCLLAFILCFKRFGELGLIFPFSEFLGLGAWAGWQWMDGRMYPGMENVWMAELLYVIRE